MRSKKGFTLIELLAIIVILAIIAVITVPIVLNIIENARKGAVQNSALGYIDAVDKYYASRLSVDSSFQLVDGIYSIVDNGYLSDGIGTYEVKFDGQAPANGFVQVVKGNAINACVGFEEYAVIITDGSISDTAKGICSSISEISGSSTSQLAVGTEYLFPYVSDSDDKEQTLLIEKTGYYKLEVWGAQGGDASSTYKGGYGGYSSGYVNLTKGQVLYVNVGGAGTSANVSNLAGGYNGGGSTVEPRTETYEGSGGGATHIALSSGTLSSFDSNENGMADSGEIDDVLIVAGGGGGGSYYTGAQYSGSGGSGGGYTGAAGTKDRSDMAFGTGGTQSAGGTNSSLDNVNGSFGQGGSNSSYDKFGSAGGGGGFYGGGSSLHSGAGGGSGYIGNSRLVDGVMYCYNCGENMNSGIRTISTTGFSKDSANCPNGYSSTAISNCAKSSAGYAKITYIGRNYVPAEVTSGTEFAFSYVSEGSDKEQEFSVPKSGYYKLEVWGASGGNASSTYKGGYGGYSSGVVLLSKDQLLYINVGGTGVGGNGGSIKNGGYNGGGSTTETRAETYEASGGGATHIALSHGTLASFDSDLDGIADNDEIGDILIVAGGGGGGSYYTGAQYSGSGGSGGGFIGTSGTKDRDDMAFGTGGTQGSGGTNSSLNGLNGKFGSGGSNSSYLTYGNAGGGGGFYGGGASFHSGAGGGSGYIGNSNLLNGIMYCYGCAEDNNDGTRTISTTGSNKDSVNCPDSYSSSPLSNCAKAGNGYAAITYIGESLN